MGDQPEHFLYQNGFHVDENDPLLQDPPQEDGEDPDIDIGNQAVDIQDVGNPVEQHFPDEAQVDVPGNLGNLASASSSNETLQAEFIAEAIARANLHNGYTGMPNSSYQHSLATSSGSHLQDSGEQVIPDENPHSLLLPKKNDNRDGNDDDDCNSELSDFTESAEASAQYASGEDREDKKDIDPNEIEQDESPTPPDCPGPPESSSFDNIELLTGDFRARNAPLEGKHAEFFVIMGTFLALFFIACVVVAALSFEGLIATKYLTWAGVMFCILAILLIMVFIAACYLVENERFRSARR